MIGYPLATAAACLLTLMTTLVYLRSAFAEPDPGTPRSYEWLFPLRGKWLFRAVICLTLVFLIPGMFWCYWGICALLEGFLRGVLALF